MPSITIEVEPIFEDSDELFEFEIEYSYFEQKPLFNADNDQGYHEYKEIYKVEVFYEGHPLYEVAEDVLPKLGKSLQTVEKEAYNKVCEVLDI